ncbi:MAG: tetratricopeptide repeat protein [Saprospiraceae bacterium]
MKNLIPPFIEQQFRAGAFHGRFPAYALNVDLSGFTPLTENLMRRGSEGAEELSQILNEIFEPLVALMHRRGGFIPYFAGDAFTAIFPLPAGHSSALHMQRTAVEARSLFQERETRFGDAFTIGIKSGLAHGEVEWGIVGESKYAFYFRGSAIYGSAHCQTRANQGDMIVDAILRQHLGERLFRYEEIDPRTFRLLGGNTPATAAPPAIDPPDASVSEEIALNFIPEAVVNYQRRGEFRTVVSVFMSFDGIETHEEMNEFARVLLAEAHNFGGYFKEIDFGDKGAMAVCFFGAPVSYENNANRALEYILTVQEGLDRLREHKRFSFRAGITEGTAFTGLVGGDQRCQYACVGNRVNLAARIMSSAGWEEVLVDDEIRQARAFHFVPRGEIRYKGLSEQIPTSLLRGRKVENSLAYDGPMVERDRELEQISDFAAPIREGKPAGVAYVFGEAGIGKSRLTYELRRRWEGREVNWFLCPADQILRKPFNPFIYFLKNYFEQSPDRAVRENERHFDSVFQLLLQNLREQDAGANEDLLRELRRVESVLAALVGITHVDELWNQLDARGRYQNTISAVTKLIVAECRLRPTVVEMEDIHWIDEDSRRLVREGLREWAELPLLLLVTSRYNDEGERPRLTSDERLEKYALPQLTLDLNTLPETAVRTFAEATLDGPITDDFFQVLLRTTNANPFYLEQVLEYFQESELLEKTENGWSIQDDNVKLSHSISAILTARIDRLSEMVRETVKAAAVIGREFEINVLSEVMRNQPGAGGRKEEVTTLLKEQIDVAERGQIWMAVNELRYIFRHSLLREAVYGMQLSERLRELHQQIATAIERLYVTNLEEKYVDLAFHYDQAQVLDKTCEYLRKAAEYARSNFQNQLALDYYDRLLTKQNNTADMVDELKTHLKRGKVLELIGEWEKAREAFELAKKLAKKSRDVLLLGQTNDHLGHLLMLRGEYDTARTNLEIAASLFESIDDPVGISRVYGNLGNLHFRQARYDEALDYYQQSLETGFTRVATFSSAETVAFLGLTYMNRGQYEEGIKTIEKQLPLHDENNDKQGLATLYTHLGIIYFESGNYQAAQVNYEHGLELAEELGNKQLIAIGTGCLGSVYEKQGDYERAMPLFQRDLHICEELGDRQGIAIAHGLIGELHSVTGDFDAAVKSLEQYRAGSKELGYKKGLAKALNTLGDVHYFREEYDLSLDYYNRAINLTRTIDNPLVLGFSLVEKGLVLLAAGQADEVAPLLIEALQLAADLGNPELTAQARLLKAHSLAASGDEAGSLKILNSLLDQPDLDAEYQASAYFERYRMDAGDSEARLSARALYEKLFDETPKFLYRERLRVLRG